MKPIVRILFGSHLYGTATPESDTDYKSVHLPPARDVLLHKTKPVVSINTKIDNGAKNTAEDVDDESFTLHKFFDQIEGGDIVSLDMLFANDASTVLKTPEWEAIQAVRSKLVHRSPRGAIGYVRKQVSKYGVKGSRVATTRAALTKINQWIGTYGTQQKLSFFADEVKTFVAEHEHTEILGIKQVDGSSLHHWEVCEKKLPFTVSLKECQNVLTRLFEAYGDRALRAEKNQGVDWKAVSHAVRAGYQTIELLNYGHITFPRPEADYLVRIKRGLLPYKQIEEELEWLLEGVQQAAETSSLPEAADRDLMNDIVLDLYENQILEAESPSVNWWPSHLAERAAA